MEPHDSPSPASDESCDEDVLEHNVRRLLRDAYAPEPAPRAYRSELTQWMVDRARNRPGESAVLARVGQRWHDALRGAVAAALMFAAGSALFWWGGAPRETPSTAQKPGVASAAVEPVDPQRTVGFVRLAVDAVWDRPIRLGDPLKVGRVKLQSGLAQIVFDKGALVNLEGPCELDIRSDEHCVLLAGRLTADVAPDAVGFTVDTPQGRVIDRGTRFGVRVDASRGTEVHVFEGRVDLAEGADRRITGALRAGQAVSIDPQGARRPISTAPGAFLRGEDVAARYDAIQRDGYRRWLGYRERWIEDPAGVFYVDFSSSTDNKLINATGAAPDADLLGPSPRWVEGRWPAKKVMLFDGRSDHVRIADSERLNLRGAFSISMWIRLDAVPYGGWTRIVGKGKGLVRNYGVWINRSQRLLWQVCPAGEKFNWGKLNCYTEPLEPGRWYHFVGVVEGDENRAYLNGRLVQRTAGQQRPVSQSAEPVTIGHYYNDVPGHTGHFAGAIGELAILNRALSDREIAEAYRAGTPDSEEPIAPTGLDIAQ